VVRVAIWLTLCACSSEAGRPRVDPAVPRDAGPADADDLAADPTTPPTSRVPTRPATPRASRPIDVILRSSPPGAVVAVDGVQVGTTPTYWAGDANGREHEFLFVRAGYAYARYRFVPITSGVIHARLEPIAEDGVGVPPEMVRVVEEPAYPAAPAPAPSAAPIDDNDPTTGPGPQP
jgi:hypothetical protein